MSINMTNVKSITLGGVSVKKIEDTSGRILWQENKSSIINITLGEGQDINIRQYYNRIALPVLNTIKSKVANKIGVTSSSINITKVELDLSTVYWQSGSTSSNKTPYFSLTTESPSYFGGGITRKGGGIWDTYELDVTNYLGKSLYGYSYEVDYSPHIYDAFQAYSGYYPAFYNNSGSGRPTYTLVVTYE